MDCLYSWPIWFLRSLLRLDSLYPDNINLKFSMGEVRLLTTIPSCLLPGVPLCLVACGLYLHIWGAVVNLSLQDSCSCLSPPLRKSYPACCMSAIETAGMSAGRGLCLVIGLPFKYNHLFISPRAFWMPLCTKSFPWWLRRAKQTNGIFSSEWTQFITWTSLEAPAMSFSLL